ncbi:VLRF1 family aeRF1-type release factor [Actinoplanes sp. NPDC049316]|uniref:VLRF1 family aeRF1-type release factor n=1 Tax=Actinoplanes sp. NPDC049316 TaxID=3154727 RepID=UPI00343977F2
MTVIRTQDLQNVARLRDRLGVLSVYVTVDPHQASPGPSAGQLLLPQLMAGLRRRISDAVGHRRVAELRQRLDVLQPAVDRLLDPAAHGLGRALFAGLDHGDTHEFAVQVPLADTVRLCDTAHLWPLAAAYSSEAPAGIVTVSGVGVRVLDYRLGHTDEIAAAAYEPAAETRELVGPGQASSRQGPRSAAQRDLHDRRMTAHLHKFLTDTGGRLNALAPWPDWKQILVTGDANLVTAFTAGLPPGMHADLVTAAHTVPTALPPAQVATLVAADLRDARRRAHRRLAEQVRDAAFAGEAATYGPADTARAAAHGRVRHLLLDGSRPWAGDATTEDSGRRELLVEQTYRAGGNVTLIDADAAGPLAGGEGIAAFLQP